jgi:hypothetical protein
MALFPGELNILATIKERLPAPKEFATMELKPGQLETISTTISSVAEAESKRNFKTEKAQDTTYSALVGACIHFEIQKALYLAGIPIEIIIIDIDPEPIIVAQMEKDGYFIPPCAKNPEDC